MLTATGDLRTHVRSTLTFLNGADPRLVDLFCDQVEYIKARTGEHLLMEGQECGILGFMLSGSARVYKIGESGREITLFRLGPGEGCILAASCILNQVPYPAFALAETDMSAVVVSAPVLRAWVEKYPFWRDYIFQLMGQRIASVITLIEEVAFRRMDVRIAEYLTEAAEKSQGILHVTHQKIAADLGTSREVVSRILKDFEHRGWVSLSRNAIRVPELDVLAVPVN